MAEGLAARERRLLCDLFDEVGPQAPTLCEGWTTHDLAAHLVVRDSQPLALPGLVVPQLHGVTEYFERSRRSTDFAELVRRIRRGPPLLPMGLPLISEQVNIHEFFIHHEDVRRPHGDPPRRLSAAMQAALWTRTRMLARRHLRRVEGLRVVLDGGPDRRVEHGEGEEVVVRGAVGEVFLYIWNRKVAEVEVIGSEDAVRRLRETRLGP